MFAERAEKKSLATIVEDEDITNRQLSEGYTRAAKRQKIARGCAQNVSLRSNTVGNCLRF